MTQFQIRTFQNSISPDRCPTWNLSKQLNYNLTYFKYGTFLNNI